MNAHRCSGERERGIFEYIITRNFAGVKRFGRDFSKKFIEIFGRGFSVGYERLNVLHRFERRKKAAVSCIEVGDNKVKGFVGGNVVLVKGKEKRSDVILRRKTENRVAVAENAFYVARCVD